MTRSSLNQSCLLAQKQYIFDRENFLSNYKLLQQKTTGNCGATIKRNAYGTGAIRAAELLNSAGCQHFFVSTIHEGIQIRTYTSGSIYVLSGLGNSEEAKTCRRFDLTPVLNTPEQLKLWQPHREQPCAIHFDTGMNRIGFNHTHLEKLDLSRFEICLLLTHLACADDAKHPLNRKQITRFTKVKVQFPHTPTSIGNSAGIFLGPEFQGDVTRPGIGLYGINPFPDQPNVFNNVVTLQGRVIQIRSVTKVDSIGYGATYQTLRDSRIAIVGVGYADGIPRALSNIGEVAFGHVRLPIVGRVTMDAIHVDCTNAPDLQENDYVEIFGSTISIASIAQQISTIPYEILTQVGNAMHSENSQFKIDQ